MRDTETVKWIMLCMHRIMQHRCLLLYTYIAHIAIEEPRFYMAARRCHPACTPGSIGPCVTPRAGWRSTARQSIDCLLDSVYREVVWAAAILVRFPFWDASFSHIFVVTFRSNITSMHKMLMSWSSSTISSLCGATFSQVTAVFTFLFIVGEWNIDILKCMR